MSRQTKLQAAAGRLARLLDEHKTNLVLAESCTGGLVSAALTRIPGISARLCGSAVVYQIETKARWLGIPPAMLVKPGPVSRAVAAEMARRVLEKTPQADLGVSVTGHLGPDAPKSQDGLVYIGVARRIPKDKRRQVKSRDGRVAVTKHCLDEQETAADRLLSAPRRRVERQTAAALLVMEAAIRAVAEAAAD